MNTVKIAGICCLLSLLTFRQATAQVPDGRDEPRHKVVFENGYVRLLEGHVPPNDTTLAHSHSENAVVVFLSKSTFGVQDVGGKQVTNVNRGDVIYRPFREKQVHHRIWNQSSTMFHFMVIELLKKQLGSDTCSVVSRAGFKFQWQETGVRVYSLEISKDKPALLHPSNCAYLVLNISGPILASSPGKISSLKENDFVFFTPLTEIEIKSYTISKCILVELE